MRNEIKIRFEEPEYEVNSEKGTVECFLRYEVIYPEFLRGILFHGRFYFYTKAVAKVNGGDVFDENIGKKISLAKAENKAYTKVRKHLIKQMTHKVLNTLTTANDFIVKAHEVIVHNEKYLEQWN